MTKRSGGHPGRRRKHGSGVSGHPGRRAAREHQTSDLESRVRALLTAEDRLGLLSLASSMLSALDPESTDPLAPKAPSELPPVPEMLGMLARSGSATGSLAWAMAVLSGEETHRSNVLGELMASGDRLPGWVDRLDEVRVTGAVETVDTLRDAADVVLEVRAGPTVFSFVTLVDFNLGTVVKDAFARELSLAEFEQHWSEVVARGDTSFVPLALADARARLDAAIEWGSRTWPPLESEDWPQSRPLLRWLLRHLPDGGADFDRPRWSERRRATLVRHLLESDLAPQPEGDDDMAVAEDLVWFRSDWGWGDPLRWSPTAVEILMLDWYPRKTRAGRAYLQRMPDVLRALVRFAHRRSKLPRRLTDETLAAIDGFEPDYRAAVSVPRAQGAAAVLERLGVDVSGFAEGVDDEVPTFRESAALQVGGDEALDALDEEPLPAEELRWEGVPDDLRGPVADVLQRCDTACGDLGLGTERRTAVRRLLRDVVDLAPAMFGRGSLATVAAAVLLLVDRVNEAEGRVRADALLAALGVRGQPSTRMDTIRDGLGTRALWPLSLGSPRYLTAAQRRYLVLLARADDDPDVELSFHPPGWG